MSLFWVVSSQLKFLTLMIYNYKHLNKISKPSIFDRLLNVYLLNNQSINVFSTYFSARYAVVRMNFLPTIEPEPINLLLLDKRAALKQIEKL